MVLGTWDMILRNMLLCVFVSRTGWGGGGAVVVVVSGGILFQAGYFCHAADSLVAELDEDFRVKRQVEVYA